jgi:hypothetical protein
VNHADISSFFVFCSSTHSFRASLKRFADSI